MSDLPSPPAQAPPRTRKKRYCFRAGDDLLLLQTVLDDPDIFSPAHGKRGKAWEVITDSLNRQGITSTGHSLRCRLKRLVETFQEEVSNGKQATAFTPLEKLLNAYTQTDARYQQRKAITEIVYEQTASEGNTSRHTSIDSGEETETEQIVPVQSPSPAPIEPSSVAQSTPESGKKPRKRRFVFGEKHDVLLLKTVLADRGIITASGTNKPAWKSIEASVNSQGLPVSIHTIRTHLGILVNTYRRESHSWDFELSEKQQLMRAYSKKLEGEEQINHDDDRHSYEPEPGVDGQNEERVEGNEVEPSVEEATTNSAPVDPENGSERNTPLATERSTATQNLPVTETLESAEPAPKRQRVEIILQRFVEDQNKRQEEQREQERARLSEQQELQRQTIDLQKRSLNIQEKAMNMQERLMALMEKVMDKLG